MAHSNDKRRARLNIISHLLTRIPYKDITRDEVVKLPGAARSVNTRP